MSVSAKPESVELPHPLPERLAELIAHWFRLLGEPTRLRVVDHLRGGEASVGELADALSTSQQNVSKHLRQLLEAGIVARTKRGNLACYEIADQDVLELCELVCGALARRYGEIGALFERPGS